MTHPSAVAEDTADRMSQAIVLQHVAHEGPERIVPVLRDFGIPVQIRRLYAGDEVPTDLDEIRALIVLGGPQRLPGDIETTPFLAQEVELLKRMVELDRPVLGICLGAQLLALAAGAKVYPNTKPGPNPDEPGEPLPELGWGPVKFPFPGGTEPIVFGLSDGVMMFHWHYDTFDLPKLPTPVNPPPGPPPPTGNVLISSTDACRNQAFRFKNRLFGFQYHFEFTPEHIEGVLEHASEDARNRLGADGIAAIREQTAKYYPRYARLGDRILKNFVQFLKVY